VSNLSALLRSWRSEPTIAGNIEVWHSTPPRPAQLVPLPDDLHPHLATALKRRGIHSLFTHQFSAWQLAREGKSIVVVTGTASGKTLCYNLPVLNRLLQDSQARALYLFPTRALAQDQHSALSELLDYLPEGSTHLPLAVYDGDTPASARPSIRNRARLVMSNPDMLHTGILPHHTNWADFFHNLQFVIIDEMHAYRGVFGSHVANVIRRLRRIARHYGATPQFILTSATIANPTELAEKLIELPVEIVDNDGAAYGERHFLIYNPPVVNKDLGLRRSALQESTRLADDLLTYNIQAIIFGRSRRTVELILTYIRQRALSDFNAPMLAREDEATRIRGYRSGYLPSQRREIEHGLRQGDVRLVVATNALELGINIGQMGAALLVGYPGTIAATWQQAGRAGRGDEASLAVLIATADPLDQFLARHSEYLFGRPPENALINPDNLLILLDHLRCATFELPFHPQENFGHVDAARVSEFLDFLRESGVLHQSNGQYFWMADQYPSQSVSLRSASAESVLLQALSNDVPVTIGEVDQASAHWMVHPGAVYIHEAQTYLVESLDLDQNFAQLQRLETDYYTEPRLETTVELVEISAEAQVHGACKAHGDIRVTAQLTGFRKLRWYTHEFLGFGEVSLPPTELLTTGYWLTLDEATVEQLRESGLWRGDPNEYGPHWGRQRDLARARDDYRCQACGLPEQGRAHDVHHKTPFRSFRDETSQIDYHSANRLDNLVTLCPSCHRRAETAVRVRSGLAGLAFTLGHLAPLFLMCDTRDLGVHSDPQSPLADGQPTVVLYDQVPAGVGFSQRLYELHDELMYRASELVTNCDCSDGCPSCVGPGGENGAGGKKETLAILKALIS
jgi:DEAD/DEAH box helicase domain-containing protein